MVAVAAIIPSLFALSSSSSPTGGGTTNKTRRRGVIRPNPSSSYRSLHRKRVRDPSNTQTTSLIQETDGQPFMRDEYYELKDEEKDDLHFLMQQRKDVESLLSSVMDDYDCDHVTQMQRPSSCSSYPSSRTCSSMSTCTDDDTTITIPQNGYDDWNDNKNIFISKGENIQRRSDVVAVIQPIQVLPPSSVIAKASTSANHGISTLRNNINIINNGRKSKIRKFAKAGMKNIPRIIHSLVGLSSIVIGFHHMVHVLITSSFTNADITISTIIGTGLVHTCTGLFGVRRLNFKNKKEAARNAMFWPAPIQGLWLASVSLSEWGQGSNALLSMWNTPLVAFTAFNIGITFWQLSQILTKTGTTERTKDTIWFRKSSHNAILVEFSYLFWMQIQMGTVLRLATMGTGSQHAFTSFMEMYPKMKLLLSNLALNTAFFNNLAILLATLLRYKIISKPTSTTNTSMKSIFQDNKIVFSLPLFSSIFIVWKVLSCFFFSYDGSMSSSFISLIFQ